MRKGMLTSLVPTRLIRVAKKGADGELLVTNRKDQETGIKSLAIPGMWGVEPGNWQGLSPVFLGMNGVQGVAGSNPAVPTASTCPPTNHRCLSPTVTPSSRRTALPNRPPLRRRWAGPRLARSQSPRRSRGHQAARSKAARSKTG